MSEVRNFVDGDLDSATGPEKPSEWAHAQVGLLQPSVCLSVCLHDLQLVCMATDQQWEACLLLGSDSTWSLSRLQTGPWAAHTSNPASTTNELGFNLKDLGKQSGSRALGEE